MIDFFLFPAEQLCAVNPRFVINAPENECSPVPAQQPGQIYRKLLFGLRGRDKARDVETSVLARGTVQPAWITPLYTWEYNTRGNMHSGHRGSSSSWPFEPRHESFFYHAHRQINEDFKAIISVSLSLFLSFFSHLKEAIGVLLP